MKLNKIIAQLLALLGKKEYQHLEIIITTVRSHYKSPVMFWGVSVIESLSVQFKLSE